jgi:hypothetical protein
MTESTTPDDLSVAADILRGARAIGREIGETEWVVYKQFAAKKLEGVWKDGNILTGSKRAIRRAYDRKIRTANK